MLPLIAHNLAAIRALARDFGVARLDLFGSACTPDFDPDRSDIDILVEYPPDYDFGPWLKRRHELQRALSAVLGHKVDLVTTRALRSLVQPRSRQDATGPLRCIRRRPKRTTMRRKRAPSSGSTLQFARSPNTSAIPI